MNFEDMKAQAHKVADALRDSEKFLGVDIPEDPPPGEPFDVMIETHDGEYLVASVTVA